MECAIEDDVFVLSQPLMQDATVSRLFPEIHSSQLESVGRTLNKHKILVSLSHDSGCRDHFFPLRTIFHDHVGEHGWFVFSLRIWKIHSDTNRPGLGVHCRTNKREPA